MFKNYHIVIFKDRQGGLRKLRLRGWLSLLFIVLLGGLGALNYHLWGYYGKNRVLERELEEAHRVIRSADSQVLSLTGKLQSLEADIRRVQQFDAKLRVLMNIGGEASDAEAVGGSAEQAGADGSMPANPDYLSRHRELFTKRLHSLVDDLAATIHLEEVEQQNLVGFLRTNKDSLLSTPSIWPVKGYLSSGFGPRKAPIAGSSRVHKGLDISNRIGTPVWAPARGTVTFAGRDGAYGICIKIDHGNNIVTRYAHLQKASVAQGDYVQRGDVIGALGNTGRSTGPHLHYEVIVNGIHVDPMRYILN
ncbi:M23 family metallopeptidase [Desulfovibrio sp. OttesenSCG-928-A18]|nr:M23 family metallopeptidase [Desulfovibrio sp. OttesenSCG-928-A18]